MASRAIKKSVPKTRKKSFALIWWLNTAFKDVLSVNKLGKTDDISVDSIVTLPWKDQNTGKTIKAKAKVLAIGGKYIIRICF